MEEHLAMEEHQLMEHLVMEHLVMEHLVTEHHQQMAQSSSHIETNDLKSLNNLNRLII
jgi:hypothetical protein